MTTIIFLVLIVVVGMWLAGSYNGLVAARNVVKNAWAQIDVQLKRRYDLIPNLVETAKDYMSYEQEVLQNVTKARSQAVDLSNVTDPAVRAKVENALSGALKQLYVAFENYPDLKANQNVSQLQAELASTENKIASTRQIYNDAAMRMNNKVEMFPTNVIAGMFGFQRSAMFEASAEEREAVKVNLR